LKEGAKMEEKDKKLIESVIEALILLPELPSI